MAIAAIFRNGKSQAIRIPKEFEITHTGHVEITPHGEGGFLVRPLRKDWLSFADTPDLDPDWEIRTTHAH